MNHDIARFNMIEQQIRPWDVLDPVVIDALFRSRRELFVPAERRDLAHADVELPLAFGEVMLAPKIEAHALQALQLKRTDKVLEVGTGSGFMASLLGNCAAQVSTVEQRPELVAMARANLRQVQALNVGVHEGDGLLGLPGDAPFDAIAVSGGLRVVPKALLDQLKVGGRLFAIVGEAPVMHALRITRRAADAWQTETLFETMASYLREPVGSRFQF